MLKEFWTRYFFTSVYIFLTINCYIASISCQVGLIQLVTLKAYESSDLIYVLTYIIDPIEEAYETRFIFSNSTVGLGN